MSNSRVEELERMKVDNQLQVEQISKVLKTKQAQARTQNNVDVSINTLIQTTQLIAEQSSKIASLALKTHATYEDDRKILISQYSSLVDKVESQNVIFNKHISEVKSSVKNAVALTSNALKDEILPDIKRNIAGFDIEVSEKVKQSYAELDRCRERVLNQANYVSNFFKITNIVIFAFFMAITGALVVSAGINFNLDQYANFVRDIFFVAMCIGLYLVIYKVFFAEY